MEIKKEVKEVELPVAKNTSKDNNVTPSEKSKDKSVTNSTENKDKTNSNVTTSGQGNLADGEGSFGFDIDWGGKGTRKIYSYTLPAYPEGVYKEIDIRLRFTILPDGTVGNILPLIKADTRLENLAINSLRQWRFEALGPMQKKVEQVAVIVFPFRLQ
jgi:protein TonB